MELHRARHARRRIALPVFALLCCLLCLAGDGSGQLLRRDPCAEAPARTPADDFRLAPQQFNPAAPQYDVNNLMLNPQWGFQIKNPVAPGAAPKRENFPDSVSTAVCGNACFRDCAGGQPTTMDRPEGCFMCNLARRREGRAVGHVNWFAATYTGRVCFHNCSYPDMDFTFSLIPKGGAGLTRWNHPSKPDGENDLVPVAMHIEMDSRETVNRFKSPFWSDFNSKAAPCAAQDVGVPGKNSCDIAAAKRMIERRRAVVVGLMGLDSAHSVYSELHPIYAMAIEVNADPNDNTWIVFARNTGNEGACAVEDHPLQCPPGGDATLRKLSLLIPPPEGSAGFPAVARTAKTQFYRNTRTCPELSYFVNPDSKYTDENQGVLVSFDLGDCEGEGCLPLVEGEIHLRWTGVPAPPPQVPAPSVGNRHQDACIVGDDELEEENDKLGRPTSAQAARLLAALAQERRAFVSQMVKCGFDADAPLERGQPHAPACPVMDPLAAPPARRESNTRKRVADLRETIERILKAKSK
ncbi:MAG TPA: hypothetical protein VGX48_22665 [Pyrinomonadaceae bacterium]|jgi:hypothetical protein|nr:hypothetical protein [Pyrinomonadaceae bacterium]